MTVFDFQPTINAVPQFQVTLDGGVYTLLTPWNLFGQRYYANLYTLGGELVFSLPLIGSPVGVDIQAISWEQSTAKVTVTTVQPHGVDIGDAVTLVVSGCVPDAYNGTWFCEITSPTEYTYGMTSDPGSATAFGRSDYNVSITAGYFASTLVFREANRQIEVSP